MPFARIRRLAGRLRLELLVRRREPLAYARLRYAAALVQAADIGRAHGFPGGRLDESGDFYLEVRDLSVYYNIRDRDLTLGDGQSLDLPSGRVSTPLEHFVLEAVPADGVYLDVGANNGFFYSLQVARRCPGARVYAFEPDPQILPHLERNVAVNGLEKQITIVRRALSNAEATGRLTAGLGASGYLLESGSDKGISVSVTTLDSFVVDAALERVDVVKVDVEGHEERVLEGGLETLATHRPILVLELSDGLLERSGGSRDRIVQMLEGLGYRLRPVDGTADVVATPDGSAPLL